MRAIDANISQHAETAVNLTPSMALEQQFACVLRRLRGVMRDSERRLAKTERREKIIGTVFSWSIHLLPSLSIRQRCANLRVQPNGDSLR